MLLVQHRSQESVKLKKMRRLILAVLLLAGCGDSPALPVYPRSVGGFTLQSEQALASTSYVPASGLSRAVQLSYQGSNPIQVVVCETTGSSVAFEALQHWRAQDGKLATHVGRYFVVAQSEKPDPAALNTFLTAFEKQLP